MVRRLVVAGTVAAAVVVADQVTKSWAVHRLSQGSIHVIWKLDFELAYNSGSAFSLAQGWAPVLAVVAVVALVVLVAVVRRARSIWTAAALGLVVGGAAGNLADRLFRANHGAVVDFIAFHFWPTFNIADTAIVVGAIWAAFLALRPGRPAPDLRPEAPVESAVREQTADGDRGRRFRRQSRSRRRVGDR
jgi:signal peptidase II